jgi:hypothetical protein
LRQTLGLHKILKQHMEQPEVHPSHGNPGFGKNSSGLGVFIIAILAVVIIVGTWWLWNNNDTETEYYRLPKQEAPAANKGH